MAAGMRHWLGLVLAGMALVAIWTLPVGSLFERPERERRVAPEQQRAGVLRAQIETDRARLQRIVWLDSLTALVDAAREEGSLFTLGLAPLTIEAYPDDVRAQPTGEWERGVPALEARTHAQVEALRPHAGDVAVGVFLTVGRDGPELGNRRIEYYLGESAGGPYCLAVKVAPRVQPGDLNSFGWWWGPDAAQSVRGNVLGACAPFLAYGRPGARIAQWLREGNLVYATGSYGRQIVHPWEGPVALPFGMLQPPFHELSLGAQRCLDGDLGACASDVARPRLDHENSAGAWARDLLPEIWHATGVYDARLPFGRLDLRLFEDLEKEFGREAFGRFWRSELDVEPAFEAAFGVPLGQWVHDRGVAVFGSDRRGHPLSAGNVLLALLAAGVALSLAVGAQVRRRLA